MAIDPEDFTRYEESLDPKYDHPPAPMPTINRQTALSSFEEQIKEDQRVTARKEVRTRKHNIGPVGKHFSNARLEDLKPVTLAVDGGLRNHDKGYGKVLICRIVSTSILRLTSLQLVIEDVTGLVCNIHLFHLSSNYSNADLETIYSPGECFAIKEPQVRGLTNAPEETERYETYIIRIESPADFVRLPPSSQHLIGIKFKTTPVVKSSIPELTGNEYFAKREWQKAFRAYSKVIEVDPSKQGRDIVLARSNRAQTLLNLKRPGAALRDCELALVDPFLSLPTSDSTIPAVQFKVNYRAALAEYRLDRYEAALNRLKLLQKSHSTDSSISSALDLIKLTEARIQEAATGVFPWAELFIPSLKNPDSPVDIANYISPKIKCTQIPGRGRGIIATRDISPGELLIVAKPLASSKGTPNALKFLTGVNLYSKEMDSYTSVNIVALLLQKMEDEPSFRSIIFDLHPGPMFPSSTVDYSSSNGIDISRLEGISTFNSFHPEPLLPRREQEYQETEFINRAHQPVAVYHFPSYMNHACAGNVTYSFLSDVFFMRCRSPIIAGEEIVASYVGAELPVQERALTFERHGFVCNCQLCEVERSNTQSKRNVRRRIKEDVENLTRRVVTKEVIGILRGKLETLTKTYGENFTLRPEVYSITRTIASRLLNNKFYLDAIEFETIGLQGQGAKFSEVLIPGSYRNLVEVPKLGDVNCIFSSLFIAKSYFLLGDMSQSMHWIRIARQMEKSHSGEELFVLRYADAAKLMGITTESLISATRD